MRAAVHLDDRPGHAGVGGQQHDRLCDVVRGGDPAGRQAGGDRIEQGAPVGKQTVYRWWPTKADVLLEALATKAELHVSVADRGSFRADLEQFLRDSFALLGVPGVAQALRSLMAEAQVDSQFASRFREGFLDRRRAALAELLQRARRRGDAPPVADELVADVVFGVIWYRVLATDRPLGEADLVALRDLLTSTFTNPDPSSRIGSTHV
jgi:AcrR family transcriptional regulator